jgi:hypothetical protein
MVVVVAVASVVAAVGASVAAAVCVVAGSTGVLVLGDSTLSAFDGVAGVEDVLAFATFGCICCTMITNVVHQTSSKGCKRDITFETITTKKSFSPIL